MRVAGTARVGGVGRPCSRRGLPTPRTAPCRHMTHLQRLKPLAATGNGEGGNEPGNKPRRRSSSKNPSSSGASSSSGDVPPPAVQLANNMASSAGSGKGAGSGPSSSGGNKATTPPPASQLASNMAVGGGATSSSGSSSGGGKQSSSPPSPAVQLANNLNTSGSSSSSTPSPAVQVANNLADSQQPQQQQGPPGTSPGASGKGADGADLLQQGIRAAADLTEDAITNSAAAAVGGIEAAASLTQSGLNAAEAAAEDALRNLEAAAQGSLNAAAAAVGGTAGAIDGVAQSVAAGGSRRSSWSDNGSSTDFESVNVRVPASAWANATAEKGRVRDNTLTQDFDEDEVEQYKIQILAAVASLDRGLAANVREARDVDRLARKLEEAAGPISLRWTTSRSSPNKSTMDRLAGTWRLIYSSGFNGGSLGGSRPGPPAAFVPTILGQVYQVINAQTMTLDNVVELLLNYPTLQLPFLPRPEPQAAPGLRLSLHHTYEVTPPNTVKIVFESTSAKTIGPDILQGLPELGVPELPAFLKLPKTFRSATFDVTYLDQGMRVTRGDRGELRIYLRDRPLTPLLPMDDSDRDYE